jgi:hypothetical protein
VEYVEKGPGNSIKPFPIPFFSFDSDADSVEKLNGMKKKDKIAAACDDLISEGAVRTVMCLIRAAEKDKLAAACDGLISEGDV